MPKVFYLCLTIFLGISSVVVSLWDKFSEPHFRPLRAGVFMSFGLSGVIPGIHWLYSHGWTSWLESSIRASFTSLIIMGALYITGGLLYASRIPERFFPGKCDYWVNTCLEERVKKGCFWLLLNFSSIPINCFIFWWSVRQWFTITESHVWPIIGSTLRTLCAMPGISISSTIDYWLKTSIIVIKWMKI